MEASGPAGKQGCLKAAQSKTFASFHAEFVAKLHEESLSLSKLGRG